MIKPMEATWEEDCFWEEMMTDLIMAAAANCSVANTGERKGHPSSKDGEEVSESVLPDSLRAFVLTQNIDTQEHVLSLISNPSFTPRKGRHTYHLVDVNDIPLSPLPAISAADSSPSKYGPATPTTSSLTDLDSSSSSLSSSSFSTEVAEPPTISNSIWSCCDYSFVLTLSTMTTATKEIGDQCNVCSSTVLGLQHDLSEDVTLTTSALPNITADTTTFSSNPQPMRGLGGGNFLLSEDEMKEEDEEALLSFVPASILSLFEQAEQVLRETCQAFLADADDDRMSSRWKEVNEGGLEGRTPAICHYENFDYEAILGDEVWSIAGDSLITDEKAGEIASVDFLVGNDETDARGLSDNDTPVQCPNVNCVSGSKLPLKALLGCDSRKETEVTSISLLQQTKASLAEKRGFVEDKVFLLERTGSTSSGTHEAAFASSSRKSSWDCPLEDVSSSNANHEQPHGVSSVECEAAHATGYHAWQHLATRHKLGIIA